MKSGYHPNLHHRRSIRLKGYDYASAGLYFITICCQNRDCLFGHIENGEMHMNVAGKMVDTHWAELPHRFPNIYLHEWVVMPNHFHGIIEIMHPVGAPLVGAQNTDCQNTDGANSDGGNNTDRHVNTLRPQGHAPTIDQNTDAINNTDRPVGAPLVGALNTGGKTIGDIMDAFKSMTTVEYIRGVKNAGWPPFDRKLWQRNYWEHIIRNEQSFKRITDYICNNPKCWKEDKLYSP